jgi:transposase
MRQILNAIFYVLKSGCQWDMLPRDFPPKGTVYHYYNTWRKDGTWQREHRPHLEYPQLTSVRDKQLFLRAVS